MRSSPLSVIILSVNCEGVIVPAKDVDFKGLVAPAGITIIAAVASGLRTGTLIGLLPRLLENPATGPLLVLGLHIAGAAATVGAIVLHSRV